MRVFEFVERPCSDLIHISSYIDQFDRCYIEPVTNSWLRLLMICGCLFTQVQWHFKREDKIFAVVRPNKTFLGENSFKYFF